MKFDDSHKLMHIFESIVQGERICESLNLEDSIDQLMMEKDRDAAAIDLHSILIRLVNYIPESEWEYARESMSEAASDMESVGGIRVARCIIEKLRGAGDVIDV